MRRAGAGICTSRAKGANRASEAGWEPRSRVLPKGRRRNKKEAGHAARADTDPQLRKVRAVPAAGQFPSAREEHYHSFRNVGPKGRNRNLKERNCSFRSEGPKGRNRKARCSSGWNDPARPTADRTVSTRSGKAQIQEVLLRIKTRKIFFCSRLFVCFPKRIKLRVGYRPAPRHGACASVPAHVGPKRLSRIYIARRLCALRLSLLLAYRFKFSQVGRGMLSGRHSCRPVGARHQTPRTHWALGPPLTAPRPPLRAIRVPPSFPDVLYEYPPLHLLDSALCSPARSLPAKQP